MGGASTKILDSEEVAEISAQTGCKRNIHSRNFLVSAKQIHRLYNRYTALDRSQAGYLK